MSDDLVNDGGIMDLWVREARLFKYGSGTGTNFSKLRGEGERLSGGGKSSGLMSFLKIGDRAAGAIKSGGTTRRAAKMVTVDLDHPDIENFIDWKVVEEQKVASLVAGSKLCDKFLNAVMQACHSRSLQRHGEGCFDPKVNRALKKAIIAAREAMVSENYIQRVIQFARQGYTQIDFSTYDTDWDSDAYLTVSGQNSNNSVRITNEFIEAVQDDGPWKLIRRTDGKVHKTLQARDLWEKIADGRLAVRRSRRAVRHHHQRVAHLPAERPHQRVQPVLRIHVPGRHGLQSGVAEPDAVPQSRRQFDIAAFEHATRLWTIMLEISVLMAQFPSKRDRQAVLRLPHPRPGLRQSRRPADGHGPALRQRGRPRALRRHHRAHDRRVLRHLGRDGARARALPRLSSATARTCCG